METYASSENIESVTLGSAYLATGDDQSADRFFEVIAIEKPKNPNIYALRSLALQGRKKGVSSIILYGMKF